MQEEELVASLMAEPTALGDLKRYAKINPHNDQYNSEKCLYCHDHDVRLANNKLSGKKVLKTTEYLLCLRCHIERDLPNFSSHILHRNIIPARLVVPVGFPPDSEGRITCSTCHNPHFWEGNKSSLRGELPQNKFCMNCHPEL